MRPRLITAENPISVVALSGTPTRFNEAAAHHRGKRAFWEAHPNASYGFNEAAAHHRGKPAWSASDGCAPVCFNEAAAHHRGKHLAGVDNCLTREASMRPRLITAENCRAQSGQSNAPSRFNEAAAHHRGKHKDRT